MLRFFHFFALILGMAVLAGCGSIGGPTKYKTVLPTDPNYVAGQEIKLKVRELADQLIASLPNDALTGFVALPTSFVEQDDFNFSSPLGRYLSEGLMYEFNQRGFPVREYRTDGVITMREGTGETTLVRQGMLATAKGKANALIIGTYHQDPDAIFVNARLIRASDGIVMRTGQIMLTPNPVTLRMTNAGPDGTPRRVLAAREQRQREREQQQREEKMRGVMIYPEPGSGPLFAHTSAQKSRGMKIVQAPPRAASSTTSTAPGLRGYVPE